MSPLRGLKYCRDVACNVSTRIRLVLQNGIPLGMFRSVEERGKGKTGMP